MAIQIFFICLIAGLILIGAEVFAPGGILGAMGALLLLIAIVDGFIAFPSAGPYIALSIIFFVGLTFYLWIKIFPNTKMGKRMTVNNDLGTFKATEEGLDELIGQEGIADANLRPAGFATIADRRIDVVTQGEMVEKGARIQVIEVEGNRVVVSQVDEPA